MSLPAQIARYRVLDRVAEDDLGELLRAVDPRDDRAVAIRLVPAMPVVLARDAAGVERALRAIAAAGETGHAGLPAVLDVGIEGDRPYVVSAWVDAAPASTLGAVPLGEAFRIAADAADALAAAHALGVMHGALTAARLVRGDDGRVRVLDLGVARLIARERAEDDVARDSRAELDPWPREVAYLAPEALADGERTPRVDVYALGVVLYELVCGRRPFTGASTAAVATAIMTEPLAPPSRVVAGRLPRYVDVVIGRALAREPAARFASMAELAAELRSCAELAAPAPRRRPWLTIAAVAGAAPIVLGVWLVAKDGARRGRAPDSDAGAGDAGAATLAAVTLAVTDVTTPATPPGCEGRLALTPDGATLLHDVDVDGARAIVALDVATGAARPLGPGGAAARAPAVSGDGAQLAFVRYPDAGGEPEAVARALGGGDARVVAVGALAPRWTADGALWAGSPALPARHEPGTGRITRRLELPAGHRVDELVELDGRVLAVVATPAGARGLAWLGDAPADLAWVVADGATGALAVDDEGRALAGRLAAGGGSALIRVTARGEVGSVDAPAVDARHALAIGGGRIAWTTCATVDELVPVVRDGGDATLAPALAADAAADARGAWSRDGAWRVRAAHGARDGLHVEAPATGDVRWVTRRADDAAPALSPDGARLYFTRPLADGPTIMVAPVPAAGAEPAEPARVAAGDAAVALDAARLAVCDRAVGLAILDLATGARRALGTDLPRGACTALAASPDGAELAVVLDGRTLLVVDAGTGAVRARLDATHDATFTGLTWPPGALLLARARRTGDIHLARLAP